MTKTDLTQLKKHQLSQSELSVLRYIDENEGLSVYNARDRQNLFAKTTFIQHIGTLKYGGYITTKNGGLWLERKAFEVLGIKDRSSGDDSEYKTQAFNRLACVIQSGKKMKEVKTKAEFLNMIGASEATGGEYIKELGILRAVWLLAKSQPNEATPEMMERIVERLNCLNKKRLGFDADAGILYAVGYGRVSRMSIMDAEDIIKGA